MVQRSTSATQQQLLAKYKQARQRYQQLHVELSRWLIDPATLERWRQTSQQALAAVSLAGAIAVQQPQLTVNLDGVIARAQEATGSAATAEVATLITQEEHQEIINKLQTVVKQPPGNLDRQEELYLEQQLSDMLGMPVAAELDGNRLNHTIGTMGGEQHLKRFPDDNLDQHDAYQESGIAPNRGAFGWFTEQGQLTAKAIQREKYYFAVQTLYLPNWNTDHARLKPWYSFRKMIVINPAEQVAVVGVVGDAGPALWVKKQFGGSPEVIREGKIWSSASRGRVILLFVDDPTDSIPLGPISLAYNDRADVKALLTPSPSPQPEPSLGQL